MGDPPLDQTCDLEDLKTYLLSNNITTIWDISIWNQDGSWKDWNIPCPPHMTDAKRQLLRMLKGKSPEASSVKDSKGWGNRSGKYSTSTGYHLLADTVNHDNSDLWKRIWAVKKSPQNQIFHLDDSS